MKLSVSFLSGVVFTLVGLVQLLRLAYGWTAQIGGWNVPLWVSGLAVLVAGALAIANFVSCHRGH